MQAERQAGVLTSAMQILATRTRKRAEHACRKTLLPILINSKRDKSAAALLQIQAAAWKAVREVNVCGMPKACVCTCVSVCVCVKQLQPQQLILKHCMTVGDNSNVWGKPQA
eukprot:1091076-Pelagomonas_calceolata.AAC.3